LCAYRIINGYKVKMDEFCLSGPGILKKKQEFNDLKAELERDKLNVQEAEEEKTNHTQKLKDLKLNLQSFKKTLFSAEKDKIKV
jgi:hypothetical protein